VAKSTTKLMSSTLISWDATLDDYKKKKKKSLDAIISYLTGLTQKLLSFFFHHHWILMPMVGQLVGVLTFMGVKARGKGTCP
jgi:hypothetical protein